MFSSASLCYLLLSILSTLESSSYFSYSVFLSWVCGSIFSERYWLPEKARRRRTNGKRWTLQTVADKRYRHCYRWTLQTVLPTVLQTAYDERLGSLQIQFRAHLSSTWDSYKRALTIFGKWEKESPFLAFYDAMKRKTIWASSRPILFSVSSLSSSTSSSSSSPSRSRRRLWF